MPIITDQPEPTTPNASKAVEQQELSFIAGVQAL
jgi:hypothetical protein